MGELQTSAFNGMDRTSMDLRFPAHQLVLSADGVDKFGTSSVGGGSDFTSFRERRQKSCRAAVSDVAADLPVSGPAIQCQRRSLGYLPNRHILLPSAF